MLDLKFPLIVDFWDRYLGVNHFGFFMIYTLTVTKRDFWKIVIVRYGAFGIVTVKLSSTRLVRQFLNVKIN